MKKIRGDFEKGGNSKKKKNQEKNRWAYQGWDHPN